MECLYSSGTPVKTSRSQVTSTHYPSCCVRRLSALPVPNLKSFILDSHSVLPLLRIHSLLTSSLPIGPIRDPRGCFSTLFTSADHSAIKGMSGALSAPLTPLQTLTAAMPNVYGVICRSRAQEKKTTTTWSTLSENITTTLIDGFFQSGEKGGNLQNNFHWEYSDRGRDPALISNVGSVEDVAKAFSGSPSVRKHTDVRQTFSNSRQQHLWSIKSYRACSAQHSCAYG